MKKLFAMSIAAVLTAGLLTGCTEGNNVVGSTVVGTAAGGLLGAALFHGQGAWVGILGGALVGGVIGNFVGKKMDQADQAKMANAVVTTPVGQQASWTNSQDVTYTVAPTRNYQSQSGHYCREYQTTVQIGGQTKQAYGKACRMPDGQWKIVS